MRYPVALHTGDGKSFGVTVPDIQGCFSAGDNEDEALDNAREAILGHLELLAESGEEILSAKPISEHCHNPDFEGSLSRSPVAVRVPYGGGFGTNEGDSLVWFSRGCGELIEDSKGL